MSEKITHEAVVSSLMDLQARLRGDSGRESARHTAVVTKETEDLVRVPEAIPSSVNLPDDAAPRTASDELTVVEGEVTVELNAEQDPLLHLLPDENEEGYLAPVTSLHPDVPTAIADSRLAGLSERLSRLEAELDGVIDRIEHFTDLQHSIDQRSPDAEE